MTSFTVRFSSEDAKIIEANLLELSKQFGRRFNTSDFVRHILRMTKTKHDLFNLNYISIMELYGDTFPKGRYRIKKKRFGGLK